MTQTAVEFLQELYDNVNLTEDDFRKAIEMEIRQTQDACTEAYDLHKNIEISDEEIWKNANAIGKITNSSISAQFFYEGAKWYKEELKSK